LEGNLSQEVKKDGTIEFQNLRCKSAGKYEIIAKNSNEDDPADDSATVELEEADEVISIIFPDTVMVGSSYDLTIEILDQNNANWIDDVSITITADKTSSDATVTGGSYKGTASFNEIGETTLVVRDKNTGETKTMNVKVTQKSFKLTAYGYTGTYPSSNLFNVMIETGSTENIEVTLTISCNKTDACSGTKMKEFQQDKLVTQITKQVNGVYVFQNFHIVSSGPFNFIATAKGYPSTISKEVITINNKFKRVNASYSELSTSGYTDVKLTTTVLGEDDEPYLYPAKVSMTYEDRTSNDSVFTFETNRGIDKRDIYFTAIDYQAVYQISTNLSYDTFESDPINIKPNKFELDYVEDDWLPRNTEESFSFDLYVKDNKNSKTIKNHDVKITFELNPSADIYGKQEEVETSNGKVTIDDLIVSESGTYDLLITCSSCETYTSKEFKINSISCDLLTDPLVIMVVLVSLIIASSLIFLLTDYKIENYKKINISKFKYQFIHIYPFTSIFIQQPRYRRVLISLQMFSAELLTLAMIGESYFFYHSRIKRYGQNIFDYYPKQLHLRLAPWSVAQAGSFLIFFMNFYSIGYAKLRIIFIFLCIGFITLCLISIIKVSLMNFNVFWVDWTGDFLIFLVIDVILIQSFYTFVAMFVISEKIKNIMDYDNKMREEKTNKENFDSERIVVENDDKMMEMKTNKDGIDSERIDHMV
jgi:hypothetical protein